jgi:hypothetical protein
MAQRSRVMARSVHGDDDGGDTGRPGNAMVARNAGVRKRPVVQKAGVA